VTRKRRTADLSAADFRYRLHLLAKAKNKTVKQIHEEAGVNPRHTRDIISRGKRPTFRLLERILKPQGISILRFTGDIKSLALVLKKENHNE
jgi:transcriptional regulator with XRE-family HTH domain|tara:strand:+ start:1152 stop:1427 length:276 start_codon:yes stop_codon:yes gene_type:complete